MSVQVVERWEDVSPDGVVVFLMFEGDNASDVVQVSEAQRRQLERVLALGARVGKTYEKTLLLGDGSTPDVLILGGGARDELTALGASRLASSAALYLSPRGYRTLAYVYPGTIPATEAGQAIVDGAVTGASSVGMSKSHDNEDRPVPDIQIVCGGGDRSALESGAHIGRIVGEARSIARELINLPPNVINPSSLADRARELAAENDLTFDVLDEAAMQELGMGSLLGVAAGSHQPPRLIKLSYGDSSAAVKVAFVGKGLTFDSGGLSLKTAEGMETMKTDMSGGAAVIAGMVAVSRLEPQGIAITGYVGATENMPGGAAMRPGDILTAMNGTTIEVLNTDAEGRLVLADVLAYAVSEGATHIVDFATLTGAAQVSLGDAATLATGMPMEWVNRVVAASDAGLDRAWPMPQYREYRQAMDSDFADLKNTGGRGGGALNAAAFLSEFVSEVPWAHMDIAGTAYSREAKPFRSKGATGVGVGTIVSLVRQLAEGE